MSEIIVTGKVEGNIIHLDQSIPELEGKLVSIKVDSLVDVVLSKEENSKLWGEWEKSGPQGHIEKVEIPNDRLL
jgi:hypothetical protein